MNIVIKKEVKKMDKKLKIGLTILLSIVVLTITGIVMISQDEVTNKSIAADDTEQIDDEQEIVEAKVVVMSIDTYEFEDWLGDRHPIIYKILHRRFQRSNTEMKTTDFVPFGDTTTHSDSGVLSCLSGVLMSVEMVGISDYINIQLRGDRYVGAVELKRHGFGMDWKKELQNYMGYEINIYFNLRAATIYKVERV